MELNIIIRTDGTIVNSTTGDEITLAEVIKVRRANELKARETAKAARAAKQVARAKELKAKKAARKTALLARKAKIDQQLKKLAA